MSQGKITDEALASMQERIGTERFTFRDQPRYEITKDAIRAAAKGIGDYSPLYMDEEYASHTPYGTLIAPPHFLWAFEKGSAADGLPGVHAIWTTSTWEWYLPMRQGDRITSKTFLLSVEEKASRFGGGRVVEQKYDNLYYNQHDTLVGRHIGTWIRNERAETRRAGKYEKRGLASYTAEQIEKIYTDYDREVRRGNVPRYFEDVQVGEKLPFVVKGPTTRLSNFLFEASLGVTYFTMAHGEAVRQFRKHPGMAFINEQGIPEPPLAIHMSNSLCREKLGLPGAYEVGLQRTGWIVHMLTNWAGDAGWVRRLEHDYNAFIIRGDTTWCHGEVIGKHEQESLAPLVIQPSSCSPSWACAIGPINGCNRGKDSKRKRSETCSAISSSRGCFPPMGSKLLQW